MAQFLVTVQLTGAEDYDSLYREMDLLNFKRTIISDKNIVYHLLHSQYLYESTVENTLSVVNKANLAIRSSGNIGKATAVQSAGPVCWVGLEPVTFPFINLLSLMPSIEPPRGLTRASALGLNL